MMNFSMTLFRIIICLHADCDRIGDEQRRKTDNNSFRVFIISIFSFDIQKWLCFLLFIVHLSFGFFNTLRLFRFCVCVCLFLIGIALFGINLKRKMDLIVRELLARNVLEIYWKIDLNHFSNWIFPNLSTRLSGLGFLVKNSMRISLCFSFSNRLYLWTLCYKNKMRIALMGSKKNYQEFPEIVIPF